MRDVEGRLAVSVGTHLSHLPVSLQIEKGFLVCPRTHRPLRLAGDHLTSVDGGSTYPLVKGVPLLLADEARTAGYLTQQGGSMVSEYMGRRRRLRAAWDRLAGHVGDQRSPASEEAFLSIFKGLEEGALCLSVGGGPMRVHPALVNVNISPFPNVDVVADAYELPYAGGTVDAVHCEAVLEHLEFPETAVREMHRVLRPGGRLFAATPLLQAFHGYPDHFQNFTLTGHVRLFERAGFSILSSGTCVGPTFALRDLAANYFRKIVPGLPGRLASALWAVLTLPFLYLDRSANRRTGSADLASTTYVCAAK